MQVFDFRVDVGRGHLRIGDFEHSFEHADQGNEQDAEEHDRNKLSELLRKVSDNHRKVFREHFEFDSFALQSQSQQKQRQLLQLLRHDKTVQVHVRRAQQVLSETVSAKVPLQTQQQNENRVLRHVPLHRGEADHFVVLENRAETRGLPQILFPAVQLHHRAADRDRPRHEQRKFQGPVQQALRRTQARNRRDESAEKKGLAPGQVRRGKGAGAVSQNHSRHHPQRRAQQQRNRQYPQNAHGLPPRIHGGKKLSIRNQVHDQYLLRRLQLDQ